MKKVLIAATVLGICSIAQADDLDRPLGFRIGQRMTLRPYVSFGYTFDSNTDSSSRADHASSWSVNPGVNLDYKANNWKLVGAAFYQYHAYSSGYSRELNRHSYGERLTWTWNSLEKARGWSATVTECYQRICQDDDMSNDGGRGLGRDRSQFTASAALNKRFNDKFHAGLNSSYYYLDYDNNLNKYSPLYGWSRWTVGASLGYTFGEWSDVFISGKYKCFTQQNSKDMGGDYGTALAKSVNRNSEGFTLHAGIGSYMTDKVKYRVSFGWSRFNYGEGERISNGFTYQGSMNWRMSQTMSMMLLASAYYHPSETSWGATTRTDSLSWGIAKSFVRGKLSTTLDAAYRHETHDSYQYATSNYTTDILTFRGGVNWRFNRFISCYGRVEYQTYMSNGQYVGSDYDYNRWRLSCGFKLTY